MPPLLLIDYLEPHDLILVLKKLSLLSLTRVRKSCKDLNKFVDDNIVHLRPQSDAVLRISINPSMPQVYTFVVAPSSLSSSNSPEGDLWNPQSRVFLTDPLKQICSIHFDEIVLQKNGKKEDNTDGMDITTQLQILRLSCNKLVLNNSNLTYDQNNFWNRLLPLIVFQEIDAKALSFQQIRNLPQRCEKVRVMYISQLGLEDYTELNRFTNVQILSSPDSKGQQITFNNFEEYLLKVKDLGHTGNLRSLRLPTAKDGGNWDCSRLIHDIDYRRFNVVKIYEGEKELWHCETSLTTLFLMELTSSQVAIIEVEELAIRVEIVTNDLKEIARIIVSFLFNWDIDASALSLLNKIQSKTWLEYPETIKSFVTETI